MDSATATSETLFGKTVRKLQHPTTDSRPEGDAAPSGISAAAQRLGLSIVSTVAECLDTLAKADTQPSDVSMFTRMKRLFGLKEREDA